MFLSRLRLSVEGNDGFSLARSVFLQFSLIGIDTCPPQGNSLVFPCSASPVLLSQVTSAGRKAPSGLFFLGRARKSLLLRPSKLAECPWGRKSHKIRAVGVRGFFPSPFSQMSATSSAYICLTTHDLRSDRNRGTKRRETYVQHKSQESEGMTKKAGDYVRKRWQGCWDRNEVVFQRDEEVQRWRKMVM